MMEPRHRHQTNGATEDQLELNQYPLTVQQSSGHSQGRFSSTALRGNRRPQNFHIILKWTAFCIVVLYLLTVTVVSKV